ncbi:MAG: hypothetical protein U0031_21480 [Thermomicrobiales bacterium]
MDGHRFDQLTRAMTTFLTRRRLTGVLTSISAAVVAQPEIETVAKKKKKKCKPGTVKCGKVCVNKQTNPKHCGGCNRPCPPGAGCANGQCQASCQSPNTQCGADCVDTDTDEKNCGACGVKCGAGQTCQDGGCVSVCDPPCPDGRLCHLGRCACRGNFDCAPPVKDPNGEWCVVPAPDNPLITFCGCTGNSQVCALGESCSACCTTEFCMLSTGIEGIICPSLPPNTYRGRNCCISNDAPCSSSSLCCSNNCEILQGASGTCKCRSTGSSCVYNNACCSGTCSAVTGKCV